MANPFDYRLFDRDVFDIEPYNGTLGTSSFTEESDTSSATAINTNRATSSMTEGADTIASASTIRIIATSSMTEGADTSAATAINTTRANSSMTEGADTVSATSTIVDSVPSGNVSVTEANDTVSAKSIVYKKYADIVVNTFSPDPFNVAVSNNSTVHLLLIKNNFTGDFSEVFTTFPTSNGWEYVNTVSSATRAFAYIKKYSAFADLVSTDISGWFVYAFETKNNTSSDIYVTTYDTIGGRPTINIPETFYDQPTEMSYLSIGFGSSSGSTLDLSFDAPFSNNLQSLLSVTNWFSSFGTLYSLTGVIKKSGETMLSVPQSEWDSWTDAGSIRYITTNNDSSSGEGIIATLIFQKDVPFGLLTSDVVEQDDTLIAANFTSDIIVTEANDTVLSTIFGPYQRVKPGQILVEPTSDVSLINAIVKQPGDRLIVTLSYDDLTTVGSALGSTDFWNTTASNYRNSLVTSGLTSITSNGVSGGTSENTFAVQSEVFQYTEATLSYNVPVADSILNPVYILVRNYYVSIGSKYYVNDSFYDGYAYIPSISPKWNGLNNAGQRVHVALNSNKLGAMFFYYVSMVRDALSGTPPYGFNDPDIIDSDVLYTGSSPNYIVSAKSRTITDATIADNWYPADYRAPGVYERSSFNLKDSSNISVDTPIGVFIWLQEDNLIQIAVSNIVEDADTLYAVNVNYAQGSVTEDDDTISSESIIIINGVDQTEQNDIVDSFGYHFIAPPVTVSTEYIGYSITFEGDAITFPTGVQPGDLLIAITVSNLYMPEFDSSWPNWYYYNGRYKLAIYSPTLPAPVLSGAAAIYILAFKGIALNTSNFPFLPGNLSFIDNTLEYSSLSTRGVTDVLTSSALLETRYFNSVMFSNEFEYNDFVSEFGSRVIFNTFDFLSGYYIVGFVNDETNEPSQIIVNDPSFQYVETSSYVETLTNIYTGIRTLSLMFLPESVTFPAGASRVELVEEDDQLIRGAPIVARMTEQDDFVRESYGYHFDPADIIGPTLIQSGYIPANNLSSITIGENELLVVLVDSTQSTIDGGGFAATTVIGWTIGGGWDFITPNIGYIHYNNLAGAIFTPLPNDLTTINGVYVLKYTNVSNNDAAFIDTVGNEATLSAGDIINYYVLGESYSLDGNVLRLNSKAVRINVVDFVDSSLGVVPADLEFAPVGSVNITSGTLSGGTDRLFSIDEVPVVSGAGVVAVVTDGSEVALGTAVGGEQHEYVTILFPAATVYPYGKDCRVESVEEDDITTIGSLIYSRNYEEDDIIRESHGYTYTPLILTSINHVNTETIGVTTTFTLSSDTYSAGDLIYIYFTPNNTDFGSATTVMQNFYTDYPEFIYHRASYFTNYNYGISYYMIFDGVTKTYSLTSPIHITILSYSGVIDFNGLTVIEDMLEFGSDPGVTIINNSNYLEINGRTNTKYQKARVNLRYGTQVTFGTFYESSTTSSYPSSLFSVFGENERVYEVENPDGLDFYTTFVREKKFPLVSFSFDDRPPEDWASISVISTDLTIPSAPIASSGNLLLIPEEVVFINNHLELIEDDDTVAAVVEKGGTSATVNVTEANDSVSSTTNLPLVSSATITEAGDTVSTTSSVPVKAAFAASEQDDFISSTAVSPIRANSTNSEAPDTVLSASVISIRSSVSITESDDTSTAASTILVKATASITEAGDTLSSPATILVKANSSNNEGEDSVSATSSAPARASLNITDSDDSIASTSNLSLRANSSITDSDDTLDSVTSGKTPLYAVITEADDIGSSTAKISIKATVSIAEADDTPSGTSKIPVVATLISVEENDSVSASSTLLIRGTSTTTEESDAIASTSTVLVKATVAITEADDTSTAASKLSIVASSTNTEASDAIASTSTVLVKATASNGEENDSVTSASTVLIRGVSVNSEDNDSVTSASTILIRSTTASSEGDDSVASTSKVAILSAVVANEQDDYLNSIVLRTIPAFTDFIATSDFAAIANRIRYSAASFEAAAELYGLGLKTITIAVEMTADSDLETIQSRTRKAFAQFESTFDFSAISIPVPGTTYRIVYVIAEINRVNVDASMNTEDVLGLANEEFILVEKV